MTNECAISETCLYKNVYDNNSTRMYSYMETGINTICCYGGLSIQRQ